MEHYITLFDSLFLPQGMVLHSSLERHAGSFTLWVLCMDDRTKSILDLLGKSTIRTVSLSEVESEKLLAVKPGRSRAEYCWTVTPFTPKIVFDRDPQVNRVTYIDADMLFLKSPQPIFDEFVRSGKAVLITDHAYDPIYDQSAVHGKYCVQFTTFTRGASEPVRQWWQDQCLEWCFARIEAGKFGDQKYLDDWPDRFSKLVHVLSQLDLLLAPWNARRFPYSSAIAWHFHGLRLLGDNRVLLHGTYSVPDVVYREIYEPYLAELGKKLDILGDQVVQTRIHSPIISWSKRIVSWGKGIALIVLRALRDVRNYEPIRKMPR